MTWTMTRPDRSWTATIAECGLDRAQPVLAKLAPDPFQRLNLAHALAATGIMPDRTTAFAVLAARLDLALGPDFPLVTQALARLPFDPETNPAATFWRGLFRDLHGRNHPALPPAQSAHFAAFIDAFRGRAATNDNDPDWLKQVANDTRAFRELTALTTAQRTKPLTPQDRSLYVRFGWNDDGAVPGLTGLLNAAALLRTRNAWAAVADLFDAEAEAAIEAAAAALIEAERNAAMTGLDDDASRYGVPPAELAAALYPTRTVPPLSALLNEAA